MEFKLELKIQQLIELIRQLPADQKLILKKEIDKEFVEKPKRHDDDLTKILLAGPVMSKEEEEDFNNFNKEFNQWTKNVFA